MNKKFRESLPSNWVKYVVAAILSVALWIWVFGLYHAPKETEKLELFYAGEIKDYAFEDVAMKAFDDLKSVSISNAYPWSGNAFDQKYSVVALTASDVVIVPESVAKETDCKRAFAELEGVGEPYIQEGIAYGVYLPESTRERLKDYFVFGTERYVAFAVAASVNSGQLTNRSIQFIEWLVR